jgi:hypothetical protein
VLLRQDAREKKAAAVRLKNCADTIKGSASASPILARFEGALSAAMAFDAADGGSNGDTGFGALSGEKM